MVSNIFYVFILGVSFFLSYYLNSKLKNYDTPGKNKVHKKKVITSAGFVPLISISIIISYLIFNENYQSNYFENIPQLWLAPLSIIAFALISFMDDLNYIPYQARLIFQIVIVFFCISLFPVNVNFSFQTPMFNGLIPLKIDVIITILFWTFLINSTNFIDGYDGMYSFQMITNFFGMALIFYLLNENFYFQISLIMIYMGIIFLPFNFNKKKKMFLGDAGSIPSGFILGWLIITLINMGHFISALFLNILFIFDVSFTILSRLINKKSIFERHNDFVFKKIILLKGPKYYFSIFVTFQIILIYCSIILLNY